MDRNIFSVAKAEKTKDSIPTEEVLKIFKSAKDLKEIKEAVLKAEDRLYASWASVDIVDKDQQRIPIEDVIKQQDVLMERGAPISDGHTNAIIGKTLAYRVMTHPSGNIGVLHLDKIYKDNPVDDKVWDETKKGVRTGSSVGGYNDPTDVKFESDKNHNMVGVLSGFHQFETANVTKPANPLATNVAVSMVAKSEKNVTMTLPQLISEHKKLVSALESMDESKLKEELKEQSEELKDYELQAAEANKMVKENKSDKKEEEKQSESLKNNKEELKMDEEVKKAFEDIHKAIKSLKKAESPMEQENSEEDKKEDAKETEKCSTKKEEASSEIAGEKGKDAKEPKTPAYDDPNDFDVLKKEISKIQKSLADIAKSQNNSMVNKASTPRASGGDVIKSNDDNLAVKIATGQVKKSWQEI